MCLAPWCCGGRRVIVVMVVLVMEVRVYVIFDVRLGTKTV